MSNEMLWGMTQVVSSGATAGPSFPTNSSDGNGPNNQTWTNPSYVDANDSSYATCTMASSTQSNALVSKGFGFSIPSGKTIDGIELKISAETQTGGSGSSPIFSLVNLLKNGTDVGITDHHSSASGPLTTTETVFTFGGPTDLWGTTWLYSDINNINFGSVFIFTQGVGIWTAAVNYITIKVYYH